MSWITKVLFWICDGSTAPSSLLTISFFDTLWRVGCENIFPYVSIRARHIPLILGWSNYSPDWWLYIAVEGTPMENSLGTDILSSKHPKVSALLSYLLAIPEIQPSYFSDFASANQRCGWQQLPCDDFRCWKYRGRKYVSRGRIEKRLGLLSILIIVS